MAFSQLRPLSLGEMLDGAFTIYRRHFASLFLTALLPQLPVMAFVVIGYGYMATFTGAAAAGREPGTSMLAGLGVGALGFFLVWVVCWATTVGAVTFQAARAYTGTPVTTREALRRGVNRSFVLIVAYALVAFLSTLGACAFLIGMVVVWIAAFAVAPAVVLERRGPVDAISRSWKLVQGGWGEVFLVTLIAGLIAALPAWGVGTIGTVGGLLLADGNPRLAMAAQTVAQVLQQLAGTLTIPFSLTATVLLYYDRRVRTEALDVQMMAESLAAPPASPPPAPGWA
jgi:hypothetical protein